VTSEEPQDPEEESQAESSAAEPAAPTQAEQDKATRKRMLIGIVGTILVLVVVFWFIFTFIIDPEVVVDAILSLDLWQLGVLTLMAVVAYVLLGFSFRNTLSNLGIKDATLGMLASPEVKGSIPGPMDTAFRFRLAVAYDYSVEEAALSAATLKALDWIARLLMIPIAIGILLVSARASRDSSGWRSSACSSASWVSRFSLASSVALASPSGSAESRNRASTGWLPASVVKRRQTSNSASSVSARWAIRS